MKRPDEQNWIIDMIEGMKKINEHINQKQQLGAN